jgi:hypothetical protein
MRPLAGTARGAKGAHMTDNLLDFDQPALKAYCERVGEKPFRATQLFRWIHHRGVGRFDDMTDLARTLRAKLSGVAEVRPLAVLTDRTAADGTRKWLSRRSTSPRTIAPRCASRPRPAAPSAAASAPPATRASAAI